MEMDAKGARPSKDETWREHATLLCSEGPSSVGGASCQSRFASSKTAVPLFREEAKSTRCAAARGNACGTATTTLAKDTRATAAAGRGRRCDDAEEGGTWRYCFEQMKWVQDSKDSSVQGTKEAGEPQNEARAQVSLLMARIELLEKTLLTHKIPIPPSTG